MTIWAMLKVEIQSDPAVDATPTKCRLDVIKQYDTWVEWSEVPFCSVFEWQSALSSHPLRVSSPYQVV